MLKKPAVSLQRAACCIVAPARAEAMLLDLVPRTVLADQAYLRRVPAVLTALVRASVEVGQTPAWVADETLEAIAEMTPEFLEDISGPSRRPGDGASRLALDIFATDPDAAAPRIALLEETMGSASALAEFDASAVTAARRRRRLPARRSSIGRSTSVTLRRRCATPPWLSTPVPPTRSARSSRRSWPANTGQPCAPSSNDSSRSIPTRCAAASP